MGQRDETWLFRQITAPGGPELAEDSARTLVRWAVFARERPPVLLVGAGMSLNAVPEARWRERGSPTGEPPRARTWRDLADRLRAELAHDQEGEESDPLWLAELYARRYGREALLEVVRWAVPEAQLRPGEAHGALFDIPWYAILTSNYDRLIEQAHREVRAPGRLTVCVSDGDLVRSQTAGDTELIYFHGILSRPETIVLSREDYRRYAQTHPGILTKIRQLFLQHPVLLVGVSATDPNFVEWSGWIRDLVGDLRNPWVSLVVGQRPGRARTTFWQGALEFVPVTKEELAPLLQLLGTFFRKVPSEKLGIEAKQAIEGARNLPQLMIELANGFQELGGQIPTPKEKHERLDLLTVFIKKALHLKYGEKEGAQRWSLLEKYPREIAVQLERPGVPRPEEQFLSTEEQRQELLRLLDKAWPAWLLLLAQYIGLRASIGYPSHLQLDLRQEWGNLPSDAPERRRLGLLLLEQELEEHPEDALEAVIERLLPGGVQTDEERQYMADVRQRRELRSGVEVPQPVAAEDAQGLRRSAFLAALHGDFARSLDDYLRAAERSRDECEPPFIEWLSVEAALTARWIVEVVNEQRSYREDPTSSPRTMTPTLLRSLEKLKERGRQLEINESDRVEWYRGLKAGALQALTKRYREERHRVGQGEPSSDWMADMSEARDFLRLTETLWAHPVTTAEAAELVGQMLWEKSERRGEAISILSRHGSKVLAQLVSEAVDRPRREPWAPAWFDLLLQLGRWTAEWTARVDALAETQTLYECHETQWTQLGDWLHQAQQKLPAEINQIVAGSFQSRLIEDELGKLWLKWWALAPAERVAKFDPEQIPRFVQRPMFNNTINILPWYKWLRCGWISGEKADIAWTVGIRQTHDVALNQMGWTLCSLTEHKFGIPPNGQALTALSERLAIEQADQPQNRDALALKVRLRVLHAGDRRDAVQRDEAERLDGMAAAALAQDKISAELVFGLAQVVDGLMPERRDYWCDWLKAVTQTAAGPKRRGHSLDAIVGLACRLLPRVGSQAQEACRIRAIASFPVTKAHQAREAETSHPIPHGGVGS